MKKLNKKLLMSLFIFIPIVVMAQKRTFVFNGHATKEEIKIDSEAIYTPEKSFGYDLGTIAKGNNPYFFSVNAKEGNHLVTVVLGSKTKSGETTIKAESRRLMIENVKTKKRETRVCSFVVNLRNRTIEGTVDTVRTNRREIGKLIWDDKLTLEINGTAPCIQKIIVEPVEVPTLFLAGNSTVVDEGGEPWCGWGQILPRFMNNKIAVANYAESGLAANTFVTQNRFAKLLSQMKHGDYLFIEFGHNDMKQKGPDKGPYTSYKKNLTFLIQETRKKGGTPVLITPMHRRRFDSSGKIVNTHGEYPNAMRQTAKELKVDLIDLNRLSQQLYEAWGEEYSSKAFVHYPANTFPNQPNALADNTHFNYFGGYEICKCVLQGLKEINHPITAYFTADFKGFDPSNPDRLEDFSIPPSPIVILNKPYGN